LPWPKLWQEGSQEKAWSVDAPFVAHVDINRWRCWQSAIGNKANAMIKQQGRIFAATSCDSGPNHRLEFFMNCSAFIGLGAIILAVSGMPASAEDTGALAQTAARYSMATVDGGVMRLDGTTGRLSFCTKSGDNFSCKAVADDRSSFMDEIEALAKENADLKKQVAGSSFSSRMPKEEDLDRAFNLMERFVKRFGNDRGGLQQPQQQ
jgi:hypothetical protein